MSINHRDGEQICQTHNLFSVWSNENKIVPMHTENMIVNIYLILSKQWMNEVKF